MMVWSVMISSIMWSSVVVWSVMMSSIVWSSMVVWSVMISSIVWMMLFHDLKLLILFPVKLLKLTVHFLKLSCNKLKILKKLVLWGWGWGRRWWTWGWSWVWVLVWLLSLMGR